MAKAFECWNDSGYYQIDSEYPNLRLVQKGSVYCETPVPFQWNPNNSYADIGVPGEASVIAFRSGLLCASNALRNEGGVYYHRFTLVNEGTVSLAIPKGWVDYWAFALTPATVHSGLQVFNQAGQLVFTGKDRPAKVRGNRNAVPSRNQLNEDWQVLDASFLAMVQNAGCFGAERSQFNNKLVTWTGYFTRMLGMNSAKVKIGMMLEIMNGPYAGGNMDIGINNYLFIDVAGQ